MRFFLSLFCFFFSLTSFAQATGQVEIVLPEGQAGTVYIDGKDTGKTAPITLADIPEGAHQLQVRGDCTIGSTEFLVTSGQTERVELSLQSMGGFVEVEVAPGNAKIFLNGRPIGTGPSVGMEIECGRHVFEFRALHYTAEEHSIDIGMGNVERLQVQLEQAGTGKIAVSVLPENADIFLDGTRVARGSATLEDVSEGSHLIGALLEGHIPLEKRVEVSARETSTVTLELQPEVTEEEKQEEAVEEVATAPAPEGDEEAAAATPEPATAVTPEPATAATPEPEEQVLELPPSQAIALLNPERRGRTIAGSSLVGVSFVTGYMAWRTWSDITMVRYENYVERYQEPNYFEQKVKPAQMLSLGLGILSGASLMTGSGLLFYGDHGAGFQVNRPF